MGTHTPDDEDNVSNTQQNKRLVFNHRNLPPRVTHAPFLTLRTAHTHLFKRAAVELPQRSRGLRIESVTKSVCSTGALA